MPSGLSNSGSSSSMEKEDGGDVIIEIQEECPPTDQVNTPQFKKSNRREYWRSIVETTNLHTIRPSQPKTAIRSDPGQTFCAQDVFLSHSGKQKSFIRQLYRDLTNQCVSCFFDEDPESLPVGEDFTSRIFEAAQTCKVAVLLLSMDFLESKWPMLELSAFVEAKDTTNPNLKILPLFFMIPPVALKKFTADNEKWKQLENSEGKRAQWQKALKAIRKINGLKFSEGGDEVKFRDEIVKEIWRILPTPSPRYHVPCIQGEARLCQEVADFFNTVNSDKKGIRIAGLYGIPGQGKTTLGKAFCNFKLGYFEGKVCHLEFSRGDSFERIKLALHYLTRCPQQILQIPIEQDQAQVELYRRVKGQRVLLVLDNITEESIDEVKYYLKAELGENSCILLSGRSVDVLVRYFKIDKQSCMRVPELKEEEAIRILLERTCVEESTLAAEERAFAVKCADRCSFKEVGPRDRTFHPLALKAFGRHLSGSHLSTWVDKIEGLVERSGYGLDGLLTLLGKAFDNMRPEYRTIFMLLTLYMPPNMSPHKVTQWLAVILNKEISFIEKGIEDLCKETFIEECGPEIRIHDLYVEFAQSKANEMGRWLWWKGDPRSPRGLISEGDAGFELARLEGCVHQRLSQIAVHDIQNLLVLQLVGVQNVSKIDLGGMSCLRSITLHSCKDLKALKGMQKLQQLAWLQISEVNPWFKLPELSSLKGLRHLEINFAGSQVVNQLGDLTGCVFLNEINVCCRSLWEFPMLKGLRHLEKVEFSVCDKVKGPLDCTECVELQSTDIHCKSRWAASVFLVGKKKVSKIVLWDRDAVKACPDIDVSSALEACSDTDVHIESFVALQVISALKCLESCDGLKSLELWNLRSLMELPSFRLLSHLTVLKLGKCDIREPPDVTWCDRLEDVCFSTLDNLQCFPNFSALRKLKKLRLYNCWRVEDPPDISGCNELQVFHLVYNDNMKGLPNMRECSILEEIKLSWYSNQEIDVDSSEFHVDLQSPVQRFKDETFSNLSDVSAPEELKEWEWLKGKMIIGIRYVRAGKMYYSITAPYESHQRSQLLGKVTVVERVMFQHDAVWYLGAFTFLIIYLSCFLALLCERGSRYTVKMILSSVILVVIIFCISVTICFSAVRRHVNFHKLRALLRGN